MKVCDLKQNQIVIGLKIKSLVNDKVGIIVKIDKTEYNGDLYHWISWDGAEPIGGFWYKDCDNEVIEE